LPEAPAGTSSSSRQSASVSSARAGKSSYAIVYTFGNTPDGANPFAGLLVDGGALYGTTVGGGTGNGTVFELTTAGKESVLASFGGSPNSGSAPYASPIRVKNAFYGTTAEGGPSGSGTVYTVTGSGKTTILHTFGQTGDGASPYGTLLDVGGTLYGTTAIGGNSACYSLGCGTVFALRPGGDERIVHVFAGEPSDGSFPEAGFIEVNGALYGTTRLGGTNKLGTVFKIEPSGKEKVLYSFQGGNDGYYPVGNLVDVHGELYGTTTGGGAGSSGTIFKITTGGKESVVYSFKGQPDGWQPLANLILVKGVLYGTTYEGGTNGLGTVFSVTTAGSESVLHSFAGGTTDGEYPQSGLVDVGGTLYGTTDWGSSGCVNPMGLSGCGIVFSLVP
jgi:uncharacterized repeat protein (TIGR03803 family)